MEISERPDEYPTNYLLDGQQRLSSLCGVLFWDEADPKSLWNIVFDLEKEIFVYKDEAKSEYFRLNHLLDTMRFIKECKKFENHPKAESYTKKAERILNVVKDYKIAAVILGDMELDEVAPIFERINSTGRRLTMVDLMRAATWSGEFDLSDTINEVNESLLLKNFDSIQEIEILRNLSTCAGYGMNKEDINRLRTKKPDQLKILAEKCKNAYDLAVDFLTKEVPICTSDYLPYSLQLTYLVEVFNLNPTPTLQQKKKLVEWFWKTSLSRYFASFNTAQLNVDLEHMRKFARNETDDLFEQIKVNYDVFAAEEFRLNKALSKAFALLLATQKPRSLLDGTLIDTNKVLSIVNRL